MIHINEVLDTKQVRRETGITLKSFTDEKGTYYREISGKSFNKVRDQVRKWNEMHPLQRLSCYYDRNKDSVIVYSLFK